jgi:hypothetical protein
VIRIDLKATVRGILAVLLFPVYGTYRFINDVIAFVTDRETLLPFSLFFFALALIIVTRVSEGDFGEALLLVWIFALIWVAGGLVRPKKFGYRFLKPWNTREGMWDRIMFLVLSLGLFVFAFGELFPVGGFRLEAAWKTPAGLFLVLAAFLAYKALKK